MTNKELIIDWINNLEIYEKDYDTLNMLLNTNNKFFVRVMTEIAKGNLQLSDFETVIGGPAYDEMLENKFKMAEDMYERLYLILGANDALTNLDEDLNVSIYENLLISSEQTELIEEVRDEELYNFFKYTPESNLLHRLHKKELLRQFNSGIIDKNFLNKYSSVPIIPINYKDIQLTQDDKNFALSKGISMEEAKKIKSLSYYYRGKR